MGKNEYTIKARNKQKKILTTETVTGFSRMEAARSSIHRTLRRVWYRITVDEKDGEKNSSSKKPTRLELTVKKNTSASLNRGYDVYSIYNGKHQHNDSLFRKRSSAVAAAKDEMDAHNSRLGVLKQTKI